MHTEDDLPCVDCPEVTLLQWMAEPLGQVAQAVIELDFALQMGLVEEANYYERSLLRILADEKNKYQEELMEKARSKPQSNG